MIEEIKFFETFVECSIQNIVEPVVDNDGILWLNEKHIVGLDHKNL